MINWTCAIVTFVAEKSSDAQRLQGKDKIYISKSKFSCNFVDYGNND
jgi:hypothetical protein